MIKFLPANCYTNQTKLFLNSAVLYFDIFESHQVIFDIFGCVQVFLILLGEFWKLQMDPFRIQCALVTPWAIGEQSEEITV